MADNKKGKSWADYESSEDEAAAFINVSLKQRPKINWASEESERDEKEREEESVDSDPLGLKSSDDEIDDGKEKEFNREKKTMSKVETPVSTKNSSLKKTKKPSKKIQSDDFDSILDEFATEKNSPERKNGNIHDINNSDTNAKKSSDCTTANGLDVSNIKTSSKKTASSALKSKTELNAIIAAIGSKDDKKKRDKSRYNQAPTR